MGSVEEKMKIGGGQSTSLLEQMKLLSDTHDPSGCRKAINSELWHACAGPLVSLPQVGTLVYYFPQGHIDQVAASTRHPATSQISNYPNLPSQLMCQVLNVTLQAEKDTDEIYAQMSLQPIKMEKDVFPVPDFGLKHSKHPTEFFCKTLTASDTSTHGGFSVPRRAAEKLFPPLDYTMQPPFQELVIKDLHDNTWTFRHIYRGQPKRHLLTTGWSVFIGSKRLRAGDSVLFIRDEKGQLMIGVRRANRQQTNIPSSVLSADSMHLGVLANAAHAAANRTPFTVFYNPRACPTNFVIPASKYRKAIYGTQISSGMRFGMMFETEESSKRRYMGTIIGISDLDPLRWPGSKWRNLQVEWDEPGCCDKQNRVSAWEIETPESLFLFPSLASGFKRAFHPSFFGGEFEWGNMMKRPFTQLPDASTGNLSYPPIQNLCQDQLMKLLMRSDCVNYPSVPAPCSAGPTLEETKAKIQAMIHKPQLVSSQSTSLHNHSQPSLNQPDQGNTSGQEQDIKDTNQPKVSVETTKPEPVTEPRQINQVNEVKVKSDSSKSIVHNNVISKDSSTFQPQMADVRQSDMAYFNDVLPYVDASDWLPNSCMFQDLSVFGKQDLSATISEVIDPSLSRMGQELWDQSQNLNSLRYPIQADQFGSYSQLSDETNNQSGIYSCIDIDVVNGGTTMVDASVSNAVLNNLSSSKDASLQYSSDCLMGNFSSSQDLHSQITSASLADSHAFLQDFHDNSGGTSPNNVEFDDSSLLPNNSWQQVVPPVRTYTKVQKTGSVGRSIDVTSFNDYDELRSAIERMFGLEGLLSDPRGSGWKLVYVDFENDVLLVGDDPWKEFVGCVRCIRILSPSEVEQMSEEGMQLLNNNAIPGVSGAT